MPCVGILIYIDLLEKSLPGSKSEDELFHRCLKSGYRAAVMGKNYIHQIGKIVASEFGLEDPGGYSGCCFRRPSATAAARCGANSLQLKHHFGWQQESPALKYVDETKDRAQKMAMFLTTEAAENTSTITSDEGQIMSCNVSRISYITKTLQVTQEFGHKIYSFGFCK